MDELLERYRELFGEPFLRLPTDYRTDDEIETIIRDCIARKEPYDQPLDPECDY